MNANIPPTIAVPPLPIPSFARKNETVLKMLAVSILVLLLLIPLSMIRSVLNERMQRRNEAVSEITATWGQEQVVAGPALVIPYHYPQKTMKDQVINGRVERVETVETATGYATFLPSVMKADGVLNPSRLHRGIYEAVVYSGVINISGNFTVPSFQEWKIEDKDILWDEAEVVLSITDLRGAKEAIRMKLGDETIALKPGAAFSDLPGGLRGRAKVFPSASSNIAYEVAVTLNGSRGLRFAPVGESNEVRLKSPWSDPSFQGAFLPAERRVGADGFDAQWKVSYYGRSYPQQWNVQGGVTGAQLTQSLFGVDLVSVVDTYRAVERAIKYGVMFIVLLFTAFFLFEVLAAVRVHPFQYTLVGVALCLFYLALLALSEVISFGAAYWLGAAVSTLMISLYAAKALKGGRRAAAIAIGLLAVYGFLFVILQLQDLSLLLGTAGLFLVLGIVMYVTRNIDWYRREVAQDK